MAYYMQSFVHVCLHPDIEYDFFCYRDRVLLVIEIGLFAILNT